MANVREYAAQTVQELKNLGAKPLAPFLPWSAFPQLSFAPPLTFAHFQTLHLLTNTSVPTKIVNFDQGRRS
jgi:hypothetical protein